MDLEQIAIRLAANPSRKSILTTKARVDATSPGVSKLRKLDEMESHLEKDKNNAVLVWNNKAWIAIFRDRSSSDKYSISRVPTKEIENKVVDKIKSAKEAIEAALQV